MSDIFISYDQHDKARAEPFARALEYEGWSVFWDKDFMPDEPTAAFVAQELDAAKCVVVLWSEQAMTSESVRSESHHGMLRNILVSVLIDETWLPFGVERNGLIELLGWDGDTTDAGYQELTRAIEARLAEPEMQLLDAESLRETTERAAAAAARPRTSPFVRALQKNREFVIAGMIGLFVLGVLFLVSKIVDDANRVAVMEEVATETRRRPTGTIMPPPTGSWSKSSVGGGGQLRPLATDLKRKGFISYGSPSVGRLNSGGVAVHILTLGAKAEYVIAGACSNDCTDLDLVVYGSDGGVVGVYEEAAATEPTVNLVSHTSGTVKIEVRMVNCTSGSCVYGVSVFEKRGTRGH